MLTTGKIHNSKAIHIIEVKDQNATILCRDNASFYAPFAMELPVTEETVTCSKCKKLFFSGVFET